MYEVCHAAVALSKENRFRNYSKHTSRRWSFVVEWQNLAIGDIAVVGISLTGMLADIFFSPRPASSFIPFCNTIWTKFNQEASLSSVDSNAMGICGLNTQRFATVLIHVSTCFSCAEYHYCVTVYRSVWAPKCLQGKFDICWDHSFPLSHTSINMLWSCRIPQLCDCLSIWCAIWPIRCLQICHFYFSFPVHKTII